MKSAFAKFNYGNAEFSGPKHGDLTLFDNSDVRMSEIKSFLLHKYKGKKTIYETLLIENIDSTPFLESDISKALKDMEGKEIKIARHPELTPTGIKRKNIKLDDEISFKGD
jgi:hypothetical protein